MAKKVRKKKSNKKKSNHSGKIAILLIVIFCLFYRKEIRYGFNWLKYNIEYLFAKDVSKLSTSEQEKIKINKIRSLYKGNAFGIDVSKHQGKIRWKVLAKIKETAPIDFVFMRATLGRSVKDVAFDRNWRKAKEEGLIRGAYHYYDVNSAPEVQVKNFMSVVSLEEGDFFPVLDVEDLPRDSDIKGLRADLLKWLQMVEGYYGVKPILYSNDSYFFYHIGEEKLNDYPIWVANYNYIDKPKHKNWNFWQFSEKGVLNKFSSNYVDLNVFNGTKEELNKFRK